ncbi:MAG: lysophospholipase [Lachnospiraceae bacterium]|nr:lysophospholipase [Lachnospiraceae bacterium]
MKRTFCRTIVIFILSVAVLWLITALSLFLGFGRSDGISPYEPTYSRDYADVFPRREVTFFSGRNRLCGWVYGEDETKDRALIVMVHGIDAGADTFLPLIREFVSNDYTVLAYDGTGTRASEGSGIRGLSQAAADLHAALSFVAEEASIGDLPLIVYGHSAGGYAAAAETADHPEIDGVVCVCAFDRPLAEMMAKAEEYAGFGAYVGYPWLALQYHVLFGTDGNRAASEALSDSKVPALIIAASEDEAVPGSVSLYAMRDRIEDPGAAFELVNEPYRDRHATVHLTKEAAGERILMTEGLEAPDQTICNEVDDGFLKLLFDFMEKQIDM